VADYVSCTSIGLLNSRAIKNVIAISKIHKSELGDTRSENHDHVTSLWPVQRLELKARRSRAGTVYHTHRASGRPVEWSTIKSLIIQVHVVLSPNEGRERRNRASPGGSARAVCRYYVQTAGAGPARGICRTCVHRAPSRLIVV
jgi:hypothetical protein